MWSHIALLCNWACINFPFSNPLILFYPSGIRVKQQEKAKILPMLRWVSLLEIYVCVSAYEWVNRSVSLCVHVCCKMHLFFYWTKPCLCTFCMSMHTRDIGIVADKEKGIYKWLNLIRHHTLRMLFLQVENQKEQEDLVWKTWR